MNNQSPNPKEKLEQALVSLILASRGEYLSAGANPLKHWDQIQDRLRASAQTSSDVQDFVTSFGRGLQLGAPGQARSNAIARLLDAASDVPRWLDVVDEEHAFLMASARLKADLRREAKENADKNIPF